MAKLVFKFNWEHRPFPYNSASGKQQFMLPFASGIPNLAPDFSQVQGTATVEQGGTGATDATGARLNLGAAASGTNSDIEELRGLTKPLTVAQGGTGASTAAEARANLGLTLTDSILDRSAGRITKVGDFGLGGLNSLAMDRDTIDDNKICHFYSTSSAVNIAGQYAHGIRVARSSGAYADLLLPYAAGTRSSRVAVRSRFGETVIEQIIYSSNDPIIFTTNKSESSGRLVMVEASGELRSKGFTVDGNGFYKNASPIVKVFSNRIEVNEEASEQEITFEKLGLGQYLVLGTSGFAQDGWYIEVPKDANGNTIVAVVYDTLENGDISIKTYKRKFDFDLAAVVADLDHPLDIPSGRWIDVRLQELPQQEVDEEDFIDPDALTPPPDFQPTNLSQAIAAALEGVEPPEINEESI
ncbi:phage tail protein [Acinetobacter courvalinii]|uniref:phage tail fiber protein n=1 Tax=Acinetobacter courvalinii TaxID=280147 RepID=UPI0021D3686E|nr:phage tail protein [Acinetobacter courvalinii]MCU4367509.1 phage tail protein [Acinetobacter courvalinii]MCU4445715.1 phage tail protein [Acinetobacter courvalinii]